MIFICGFLKEIILGKHKERTIVLNDTNRKSVPLLNFRRQCAYSLSIIYDPKFEIIRTTIISLVIMFQKSHRLMNTLERVTPRVFFANFPLDGYFVF